MGPKRNSRDWSYRNCDLVKNHECTEIVDFRKDWGLSNHIIHGSWDNDSPRNCGLKHLKWVNHVPSNSVTSPSYGQEKKTKWRGCGNQEIKTTTICPDLWRMWFQWGLHRINEIFAGYSMNSGDPQGVWPIWPGGNLHPLSMTSWYTLFILWDRYEDRIMSSCPQFIFPPTPFIPAFFSEDIWSIL